MREELRDQRRRHIGDATLELAAGRGIEAVSLRSVAAQARTSPGQVQYQFETVAGVVRYALQHAVDLIEARLADDTRERDQDRLKAMALRLLADDPALHRHLRAFAQLRTVANQDAQAAQIVAAFDRRRRDEIGAILDRATSRGLLHTMVEPEAEAVVFWTLLLALAIEVAQGLRDRRDAQAIMRYHFLRLAKNRRVTRRRPRPGGAGATMPGGVPKTEAD